MTLDQLMAFTVNGDQSGVDRAGNDGGDNGIDEELQGTGSTTGGQRRRVRLEPLA